MIVASKLNQDDVVAATMPYRTRTPWSRANNVAQSLNRDKPQAQTEDRPTWLAKTQQSQDHEQAPHSTDNTATRFTSEEDIHAKNENRQPVPASGYDKDIRQHKARTLVHVRRTHHFVTCGQKQELRIRRRTISQRREENISIDFKKLNSHLSKYERQTHELLIMHTLSSISHNLALKLFGSVMRLYRAHVGLEAAAYQFVN